MKPVVVHLLLAISLIGCNRASPEPAKTSSNPTPTYGKPAEVASQSVPAKDNTAINERDRTTVAKTPIDQNENQKDIDITASIRKRVVDSKMSTNAHNAKIITQDGKVTLRGPVKSEEEKKQIQDIAVDVAGSENVDNQLEVQP